VIAATAVGVALCGIFLVPEIWLSGHTQISAPSLNRPIFGRVADSATPWLLFDPWLPQGGSSKGSDLRTQAVATATWWVLLVGVWAGRRRLLSRPGRRVLVIATAAAAGLTVAIGFPRLWLHLPSSVWTIQFPFRLVPYLSIAVLLGAIALLREPAVARRRLVLGTLLVAVVWQVGTAAFQAIGAQARPAADAMDASAVHARDAPTSFADEGFVQASQFRLTLGRPVARPASEADAPVERTPPPDRITVSGQEDPGTLLATNIVASPLIRIDGDARSVGRDADGFVVLEVVRRPGSQWRATIRSRCTWCVAALWGRAPLALFAGRAVSAVAALVAAGSLFNWRRRRPASGATTGGMTSAPLGEVVGPSLHAEIEGDGHGAVPSG
jgi:hypothetical protein